MKTPILDKQIERMEKMKKQGIDTYFLNKRLSEYKSIKKQLTLTDVGSNEVEFVCEHNWLTKFNSGNFIVGRQCSKCKLYVAY